MSAQGSTRDEVATAAAGAVLLTLASAQFLMTLDSSVMNVSMATVANDVGTTITGIQTAITLYTLVMATLMITGGKIGTLIGRRRAFAIGCVDLRPRLVRHRPRAEPDRPDHRLVVPRGHRRRADHARDRRAGRRQLRAVGDGRAPTAWSRPPAPSPWPSGRSSAAPPPRTCPGGTCSSARCVVVLVILVLSPADQGHPPRRAHRTHRPGRHRCCRSSGWAPRSTGSCARASGGGSPRSPARPRSSACR